ncbi:MAG: hypothetical protein EBW71_10710 [Betaproteobacteria bacterium]|nr:hypothetical protein [Betaproteobacteria bacterium]
MIKRVVEELTIDFPRLKTFVTLSPIPGYRQWLSRQLDDQWPLIDEKAIKAFDATLPIGSSSKDAFISLSDALIHPNPDSPKQADAIKTIHLQLAARYLSQLDQHNEPVDPVARFHLGNGARIERLNWLADPSPKGLKQSYGLMINYLYDLKRLDRARSGLAKGKIAMSPEVESLLKS